MSSQERLQSVMDRLEIRELIDKYVDAVNHRDWDQIGTLFIADYVWSVSDPINVRLEGRQAMLDLLRTVQEKEYEFVFQMGHGVVIDELTSNYAKVRHTLHEISSHFVMLGIYYDEVVKEADGVWRFKRRDYQVTYYEEGRPLGKVFRRLPDPSYHDLPRT